jgi:hypothetical protein
MVDIQMRAAAGTFSRELRMAAALRPVLLYLGFLAAVAAGAALLALVNGPAAYAHDAGGHAAHAGGGAADATPIRLLEPADGAAAGDRIALVFATEVPLEGGPDGWGARGLHLHAGVNGAEIMSGGARIEALGGNRYRWELPLAAGTYRVELFWASHQHGRIARGAATPVEVTVGGAEAPAPAR